jgi:hypothetical protein
VVTFPYLVSYSVYWYLTVETLGPVTVPASSAPAASASLHVPSNGAAQDDQRPGSSSNNTTRIPRGYADKAAATTMATTQETRITHADNAATSSQEVAVPNSADLIHLDSTPPRPDIDSNIEPNVTPSDQHLGDNQFYPSSLPTLIPDVPRNNT